MSSSQLRLCDHLLEAGLQQPFALLSAQDGQSAAYLCPVCLADECTRRIDEGVTASALDAALSFAHCDHVRKGKHSHCFRCETASTAALSGRWAALSFTDSTLANRLARFIRHLAYRYDRAGLKLIGAESQPEIEANPYDRSTGVKRLGKNATQKRAAGLRWHEEKVRGTITRQSVLRRPVEAVTVVPPR